MYGLPVAPTDRPSNYESGGHEFESLRARHYFNYLAGRRRLKKRISLRFSLRNRLQGEQRSQFHLEGACELQARHQGWRRGIADMCI